MIPHIDLAVLRNGEATALEAMKIAATDVGFAMVYNTTLSAAEVTYVIETYRAFFKLLDAQEIHHSIPLRLN
jgi:isopenicillin N synthase-like dioxygenase